MKLLSYRLRRDDNHPERPDHYGILADDGIVDLRARLGKRYPDLKSLLAAQALHEIEGAIKGVSADLGLEEITFLPPITGPDKILCIGVNYAERNAEYKDGSDTPKHPSIFPRFARSFVGHNHALQRPPESVQLDYEGEIAIVIGKRGRRIPQARAREHVAGLTCLNEGTIRDWVRHGKFNVTQGKNWDASGSIGPWMVTTDRFEGFDSLTVTTRVNGDVRQHDSTSRLAFPFEMLIEYVSTFTTLEPGDIISTGTPTGAGARMDPPRWLAPGDIVEVEVPGIGILSNPVADEAT